ncbi:hypothetical protein Avbf_05833 [Armadillidium vulgare]|nr:hypothetical protein Avbf_05833 [Armadillidium vulgare]
MQDEMRRSFLQERYSKCRRSNFTRTI